MEISVVATIILLIIASVGSAGGVYWYLKNHSDQATIILMQGRTWMDQHGEELRARDPGLYASLDSALMVAEAANANNAINISTFVKLVYAMWGIITSAEKVLAGVIAVPGGEGGEESEGEGE